MSNKLEHGLPNADDAETVCLGAVFLDQDCMAINVEHFGPDDLYSPFNRTVYQAQLVLHHAGKLIDPITVGEEIKKTGEGALDALGGVTRITALTTGLPHFTPESLIVHAKEIRRYSVIRSTIRLCNRISNDLLSPDLDPEEVIAKLETKAIQFNNAIVSDTLGKSLDGFVHVSEIVPTLKDRFERMHDGEVTGTATGMEEIDNILDGGGLQRKGTYLVGGREKTGKTSLALGWLADVAIHQDKTAMMLTLEMSKEILMQRLYSAHMGIPYYMFRPGFYDSPYDNPYTRAIEGLEEFGKYPFVVSDNLFDWHSIRRHCLRTVEQHLKTGQKEVGIIVIDYMQLMYVPGMVGNREREVAEISRGCKQLSSECDVPVIVMSNLNRIGEQENLEPDTLNLRESGQLAYDAEGIFFVHNPSRKYGQPYTPQEVTDMTLILSRQRNGPPGRFPLKYVGKFMQFLTESQYAKSFGNAGVDQNVGRTPGQEFERQKKVDKFWDEDEDDDSFLDGGN